MTESPYRSSRRARKVQKLSFFHARFVFGGLLGVFALLAVSSLLKTPRTITVECRPKPDPAVECTSSAGSFWGGTKVLKSHIRGSPGAAYAFDALEIDTEYTDGQGETHEGIRGRFGSSYWTWITETYPLSTGRFPDFFRFRNQLRAGQPATLVYRTGWGGEIFVIPMVLAIVLMLWRFSGSSFLVHHVDDRIVEAGSKNYWHSSGQRRRLSRDEIEDAVVTATPAQKGGGTVYRPALRLTSGEVVDFGVVGATSPPRAEHLVRQIRELLELPDAPIATIDRRSSVR